MAILYNSNYDNTVPFSDVCATMALATGVAQTYTVPGTSNQYYSMRLSYTSTSNVFVSNNPNGAVAATVPGAGLITTHPYNEFRPGADGSQRYVKGGDVVSFITPDASAYVGVRLMSLVPQG